MCATCRSIIARVCSTADRRADDAQYGERVADRRQRVAQLVREHRQEFVLPPIGLAQTLLADAQRFVIALFRQIGDGQAPRSPGFWKSGHRDISRERRPVVTLQENLVTLAVGPVRLDQTLQRGGARRRGQRSDVHANQGARHAADHFRKALVRVDDQAVVVGHDCALRHALDQQPVQAIRGLQREDLLAVSRFDHEGIDLAAADGEHRFLRIGQARSQLGQLGSK